MISFFCTLVIPNLFNVGLAYTDFTLLHFNISRVMMSIGHSLSDFQYLDK